MYQTTIKDKLIFSGKGLHSGKFVKAVVYPALPDNGITIRRADIPGSEPIKLNPYNVVSTVLATTVNCGNYKIATVEHILSAVYGLGIDNIHIDVYGEELPILDGSAAAFVDQFINVGIKQLKKKRKYLKFTKRIRIEKGDKWIELIPSRYFKVTFGINFDNKLINEQKKFLTLTPETYAKEVAKARTFGFKNEVEMLWKMGLAKGGSLENAIVIDKDKILNEDGLRYNDEFVRHKILDLIGDISLIGYRFYGHIRAYKSGHELNNYFAKTLLESKSCYKVVELDEQYNFNPYKSLVLEPQGT
ncbi:UDP-3-O-[3-hydroxymyristoyl] N-acetylglucosamine deacetylase [Deferribacter desulfuricans SSM1]|uniref:UDP-3-O-acyl-N-acetylglucosamine deacetylase n=1 Tax=Deferribacter desulfuricans (strain DSM 14783 / JCM 11476 / NBRC 101012 / SSM1) TaxID=639282 RepID=D3PAC2_DEFDS|nr:UDP-3-O-acyl-N-acetylglucosamine deacetylase [Deferribacter desulfuricans]BAI79545.1 UDP-3-O-[3-hydroxymyristoyl] N-acetylglucosamine deacetylase [Deferribacter desulfuricans SSM1]